MDCAANIMVFMPEAQTLLTSVVGTDTGMPAPSAICREGACPAFAGSTLPR